MPHALVTGAAGFIGRALCQRLLSQGWQVTGLDALHSASSQEGLVWLQTLSKNEQFQWQQLDLSQQLLQHPAVDCVFHLAALPGVRSSWERPLDYDTHNLKATQLLLDWCQRSGTPTLIFASSSSVYGNGSPQASRECDPLQPLSAYALSKVRAEQYLQQIAHSGLKILILRLFTVYGPGQRPDMAIRRFVEAISQQQPFVVHDPHLMRRDFTHLTDILQGFIQAAAAIQHLPSNLNCFNLGSGRPVSLPALIEILEQALNQTAIWQAVPSGIVESRQTWADIRRAQDSLNYQACVTLKQGLYHYCKWYQSQSPKGNGHDLSIKSEWTRQLV